MRCCEGDDVSEGHAGRRKGPHLLYTNALYESADSVFKDEHVKSPLHLQDYLHLRVEKTRSKIQSGFNPRQDVSFLT